MRVVSGTIVLSLAVAATSLASAAAEESDSSLLDKASSLFGLSSTESEQDSEGLHQEEKLLQDLKQNVERLQQDNKELRGVVFHLLQQQKGSSTRSADVDSSKEEHAEGESSDSNAMVSGQVERFERQMAEGDGDSHRDYALLWFKGDTTAIRMGQGDGNSTIKGSKSQLDFNADNLNMNSDSVTLNGWSELKASAGESELTLNHQSTKLQQGKSELSLNTGSTTAEDFTGSIQTGSTILGFGSTKDAGVHMRAGDKSSMSFANVEEEVSGLRFTDARSNSSLTLGEENSAAVHLRAGEATVRLSELGNNTDSDNSVENYLSFMMRSGDSMIGFGQNLECDESKQAQQDKFVGILLDGGPNGTVMMSSGHSSFFMSSGEFGNNSDCADVAPHDVVFTAGEGENDDGETEPGAFHFVSGNASVKFSESVCEDRYLDDGSCEDSEYTYGGTIRGGSGQDLYLRGGNWDGEQSGSIHVNPGRDQDNERTGNVHIGGGEGFSAVYTGTVNITFTADEVDEPRHWAANVSLKDYETCGIAGYKTCSKVDIIYVTSSNAAMSATIIDEEFCLAYVRAMPFDDVLWRCEFNDEDQCIETEEHTESFVNFLIIQRRNAGKVNSPGQCSEDALP